ncbi:MAG: hypothetical protein BWZ02_02956 [Lentisphaerae bacterium ADurb.BinA184]|nr:MAG: hypothetical protein BWZ02_02956 [Lentisphaerae bacterium ADurb.BinA184]
MMTNPRWQRLARAAAGVAAGGLVALAPAQGAWVLQDDHEGVPRWSHSTIVVDPADSTNHAFVTSGASGHAESLPLTTAVADGTQATLFARFYVATDSSPNLAFAIGTEACTGYGTASFCVMPGAPPGLRGVGQAGETGGSDASWVRDAWVPFWITIDNAAHTFNVHVGANPASPNQADPVAVFASDLAMRALYLGDITRMAIEGWSSGPIHIDDIYLDTTGFNLTNPLIPEPATLALGLAGGALLMRRRRA